MSHSYLKPPIIYYKRGKSLKIKNLIVRLPCEATAKTTLGVRAGLSLTYSSISSLIESPIKLIIPSVCELLSL